MSTVLLLSPAVQPCLRSPRRFWCADRGQLALIRIPAFPSSFLLFAWLAIINTTHTRGLSCERRRKRGAVRHVHDIKTSRLRLRQRLKTCCVTGKTQANYPDFCIWTCHPAPRTGRKYLHSQAGNSQTLSSAYSTHRPEISITGRKLP